MLQRTLDRDIDPLYYGQIMEFKKTNSREEGRTNYESMSISTENVIKIILTTLTI